MFSYLYFEGRIIVGQVKVLIPLVSMLSLAAIFAAISATRPRADVAYCIHALARRLSKTHNWAVCAQYLRSCAKYDCFFYMNMNYCQYIHLKTWNAGWSFYEFIIGCFHETLHSRDFFCQLSCVPHFWSLAMIFTCDLE